MTTTKKIMLIPALAFSLLLTTVYANQNSGMDFPEVVLANSMKGFMFVP